MRRIVLCLTLAAAVFGCSREEKPVEIEEEMSGAVKAAIDRICRLEGASVSNGTARVVDVRGMSARAFKRELVSFEGEDVHVWMPGEKDWLLISTPSTNAVSLAGAMDDFASDTNCTMSVAEVFASYVGRREEILPAFESSLKGDVMPQWFVTKDIPSLPWLDVTDIDDDIRRAVLAEIRSMQVVRRQLLEGNIAAAKATDKKGEEAAIEFWARAAMRNPNDPMLLERIENLNRNAKGFLEVNKILQALKCYETLVLIRPNDAVAVHNFGMCLKRIGKLDMANEVLERAEKLLDSTLLNDNP